MHFDPVECIGYYIISNTNFWFTSDSESLQF